MGGFKPLLKIGGRIALFRLLDSIAVAGIGEIIVVTGHRHEQVSASVRDWCYAKRLDWHMSRRIRVQTVYNENYEQGMFTSVQTGIRALCRSSAVFSEEESACRPAPAPSGNARGCHLRPEFCERVFACGLASGSSEKTFTDHRLKAALLFPVDVPMVPAGAIRMVLDAWEKSAHSMAVACFNGKKGHPLLIPACDWDEILTHDGNGGLKAIRERHKDRLLMVETGAEGVILDMDTPAEYQEIQRFSEGDLCDLRSESGFTGRLVLVRHGETQRHSGKIFLGQTDVPLSREGCEQAVALAEEIKRMRLSASRIYSSDLSRTMQTAQILAHCIDDKQQVKTMDFVQIAGALVSGSAGGAGEPTTQTHDSLLGYDCADAGLNGGGSFCIVKAVGLREICLGEWDGCLMDEIRSDFPDEFEQRGQEILCFKPPGGEDFYDMRRRVLNSLRAILSLEKSSDVLIVTHAGPIRAMVGALRRLTDEEAWALPVPRGSVIVL
jgi:broad specificity phosphatase PhoE/CTP:molybdopterin cytidylyltransferase MocA